MREELKTKMAVLVYFKINRPLILYIVQFSLSGSGRDFCVDAHEECWSMFAHVCMGVGARADTGCFPQSPTDLLRQGAY